MPCVTCCMPHVGCLFFVFFFLQRVEANWLIVCYQRGVPCLVLGLINFLLLHRHFLCMTRKKAGPVFKIFKIPVYFSCISRCGQAEWMLAFWPDFAGRQHCYFSRKKEETKYWCIWLGKGKILKKLYGIIGLGRNVGLSSSVWVNSMFAYTLLAVRFFF